MLPQTATVTIDMWDELGNQSPKSWHHYDALNSPSDPTFGTEGFSMKANTVCAVGEKNGTSWIVIGRRQ